MDIRSLRKQRGWSQEELANRSGLSVRTIQRLEVNKQGQVSSYRSVAKLFGVSEESIAKELVPNALVSRDWAFYAGVVLILPSALFFVTNVIRYELGLSGFPDIFAPMLDIRWLDFFFPFLILGACLASVILNLASCFGWETSSANGALLPRRVALFSHVRNLVLAGVATLCFVATLGYAIFENLAHWIGG